MKNIKLGYTKFRKDISKYSEIIKEEYSDFDFIVGISRGGLIPAVHLSHLLDKPLDTLNWSLYNKAFPGMSSYGENVVKLLLLARKILLVDDLVDSGESIHKLYEMWSRRGVDLNSIKLFTIHYNKNNRYHIKPDWYMYPKQDHAWIQYPWEVESK